MQFGWAYFDEPNFSALVEEKTPVIDLAHDHISRGVKISPAERHAVEAFFGELVAMTGHEDIGFTQLEDFFIPNFNGDTDEILGWEKSPLLAPIPTESVRMYHSMASPEDSKRVRPDFDAEGWSRVYPLVHKTLRDVLGAPDVEGFQLLVYVSDATQSDDYVTFSAQIIEGSVHIEFELPETDAVHHPYLHSNGRWEITGRTESGSSVWAELTVETPSLDRAFTAMCEALWPLKETSVYEIVF